MAARDGTRPGTSCCMGPPLSHSLERQRAEHHKKVKVAPMTMYVLTLAPGRGSRETHAQARGLNVSNMIHLSSEESFSPEASTTARAWPCRKAC